MGEIQEWAVYLRIYVGILSPHCRCFAKIRTVFIYVSVLRWICSRRHVSWLFCGRLHRSLGCLDPYPVDVHLNMSLLLLPKDFRPTAAAIYTSNDTDCDIDHDMLIFDMAHQRAAARTSLATTLPAIMRDGPSCHQPAGSASTG